MEKVAERIKNIISENNPALTVQQLETIKFGLECFLSEASKIAAYLIIFAMFSLTEYYLVALAYFTGTRLFAGGFHAATYIQCFIISLSILSAGIFTGSIIGLPLFARSVLMLVSITLAWILAPVDHPNKPIISIKRRKLFKYISTAVFIFLAGLTFVMPAGLASTAVVIMFLEALLLLTGYFFTRRKQNYECA